MRVTSAIPLEPTDVVRVMSTKIRLELDPADASADAIPPPLPVPGGLEAAPTEFISSTIKRDGLPPPPAILPRDDNPDPIDLEEENRRLRAELQRLRQQLES